MDPTWQTLGILLVGMVVVIGGILALRMHAFLALLLGAVIVAALTPTFSIEWFVLKQGGYPVTAMLQEDVSGRLRVELASKAAGERGSRLEVIRRVPGNDQPVRIAQIEVETSSSAEANDDGGSRRVTADVLARTGDEQPQPGDLAVTPAAIAQAAALARQTIGQRVATGFGSTATNIGILIAMASVIGKCLLDSGAADRIVRSALRLLGERGAPLAFLWSGFLLGIPVFFDTVFYLMIPLGKAMRLRTGRNYLLYVLTIVAGATMAHSLVPPTPGPLFVAEQLGVDLGLMILAGCIVGVFTAGFGYVYAVVANRLWDLELRESPDFSMQDLEEISSRSEGELPPLSLSLLPIVLPVVLISGNTVLKSFGGSVSSGALRLAATLGDKNVALMLSAAIALATLVWQSKRTLGELSSGIQAALATGGVIILITSAGGAFGRVLQQTGVSGLIESLPLGSPVVVILLAFLVTAAIRTAQGSATVAMITAVGILAGLADSGRLGFHPVYLALAIGCGSKPIGWMNDSGFWVIGKMSGMTEGETLKYVTPMSAMMGVVGLVVVLIGVTLFPMA